MMNRVEVRPDVHNPDRYTAMIVTDAGESTTFDCTHLHHTERTAMKCVARVAHSWAFWHEQADDAYVFTTTAGHVVRVCRRHGATRRYSIVVQPRCPTCAVPLSEPPTSDDCPSPEDHAR